MTIREFARTIWAAKYYVLAAVLVVVAGAVVYLKGATPTYEASAEVQLTTAQSGDLAGGDAGAKGPTIVVGDDISLVRSSDVTGAAASALGGGEDPAALHNDVVGTYDAANHRMKVTARAEDPAVAEDRANAMAQAYIDSLEAVRDARVKVLSASIQGLNDQIEAASADSDAASAALRSSLNAKLVAATDLKVGLEQLSPLAKVSVESTGAAPVGLSPMTVLAIAVLLGLLIGVGLAFARRGLDTRVGSSTEAAALASSPVLAELYGVGSSVKDFARTGVLPVSSRTASPYTESIRELRTAIQVPLGESGYAVVAVTAADPHAPRAFITANLAASFALSGRATVVVPGDLRQPQLAEILPPPVGWQGSADTLRPTRIPNLSILPVHDEELDPADFLATDALRTMIAAQRSNAVVVVIDSPPVLAAADATIIGGYAQGVVLVASAGKTNRAVLQEAAERLRTNNVPLVGIALTGLASDRRMLYASTYGQAGRAVASVDQAPGAAPAEQAPDAASGKHASETAELTPESELTPDPHSDSDETAPGSADAHESTEETPDDGVSEPLPEELDASGPIRPQSAGPARRR